MFGFITPFTTILTIQYKIQKLAGQVLHNISVTTHLVIKSHEYLDKIRFRYERGITLDNFFPYSCASEKIPRHKTGVLGCNFLTIV